MNRTSRLATVGLALGLVAGAAAQTGDDAQSLYAQATTAYEGRDYARSIELYKASIEKGLKSANAPYNTACCYALLKKPDEAFEWLNRAIDQGWRNLEHLGSDTDLAGLHEDKRWAGVVRACEAARDKYFKSLKQPELARELMQRMEVDQQARRRIEPLFAGGKTKADDAKAHAIAEEIGKIDTDNTAWMKLVIEKHDWPGKTMVGEEAANAAWLLVQHADRDPAFQRKCLDLITIEHSRGEVTGSQVAYLTDRVLLKEGKKQLYGTQFTSVDGELKPQPIEDEENVDKRRKEVGLGTLAEYAKMMRARSDK